jgi:hypothetical protein
MLASRTHDSFSLTDSPHSWTDARFDGVFFIATTDLCFFAFGAGVIGRVIEGNR